MCGDKWTIRRKTIRRKRKERKEERVKRSNDGRKEGSSPERDEENNALRKKRRSVSQFLLTVRRSSLGEKKKSCRQSYILTTPKLIKRERSMALSSQQKVWNHGRNKGRQKGARNSTRDTISINARHLFTGNSVRTSSLTTVDRVSKKLSTNHPRGLGAAGTIHQMRCRTCQQLHNVAHICTDSTLPQDHSWSSRCKQLVWGLSEAQPTLGCGLAQRESSGPKIQWSRVPNPPEAHKGKSSFKFEFFVFVCLLLFFQ